MWWQIHKGKKEKSGRETDCQSANIFPAHPAFANQSRLQASQHPQSVDIIVECRDRRIQGSVYQVYNPLGVCNLSHAHTHRHIWLPGHLVNRDLFLTPITHMLFEVDFPPPHTYLHIHSSRVLPTPAHSSLMRVDITASRDPALSALSSRRASDAL